MRARGLQQPVLQSFGLPNDQGRTRSLQVQEEGARTPKGTPTAEQVDEMKIEMVTSKINALKSSLASQDPPRSSVYGICLVLPQVARSLGWPPSLFGKVLQAYVILAVCWFMQIAFIFEIYRIEVLRSLNCEYAYGNATLLDSGPTECELIGYMRVEEKHAPDYTRWHLCGSHLAGVPYMTRMLCITIFIVYISSDLGETWQLMRCIIGVETGDESWAVVKFSEESTVSPNMKESKFLDSELQFSVNALTLPWKIANVIVLVLTKITVVVLLIMYGTSFLFNESDRIELILNAIAFCFIIDIDEMLFSACASQDVREKMDNLQSYTDHLDHINLPDSDDLDDSDHDLTEDEVPMVHRASVAALTAKKRAAKMAAGYGAYFVEALKIFIWPLLIAGCTFASFEYYASYCPVPEDEL